MRPRSPSPAWPSPAASISTTPWHRASTCSATSTAEPGQQCMELYEQVMHASVRQGRVAVRSRMQVLEASSPRTARSFRGSVIAFIPIDPRVAPLLGAGRSRGAATRWCPGATPRSARKWKPRSSRRTGKPIPMNIDGVTAVIFCELGFPPPLGRGLFILSRSVGILAHAWEQMQHNASNQGTRCRRRFHTRTADRKRDARSGFARRV